MDAIKKVWRSGRFAIIIMVALLISSCDAESIDVPELRNYKNYEVMAEWQFDRYGFLLDIRDSQVFMQVIEDYKRKPHPISYMFLTDDGRVGYYKSDDSETLYWGEYSYVDNNTYRLSLPLLGESRDFRMQGGDVIEIYDETETYQNRYPDVEVKLVKVYRHYVML